ncbi:MAG: hypothetical protein Q7R63_00190 [bacterium]|nr:hypothetical protein [bacterium]
MKITKILRDYLAKILLGTASVPRGLFELNQYFRHYGPINFKKHQEGGMIIAVSDNFRFGSIVTSGSNEKDVDMNIRDAILTAFEIPSAYQKEAAIIRVQDLKSGYALA